MLCMNVYNIDISEVAEYNKHILDLYDKKENSKVFTKNWNSWFFKNQTLKYITTEVFVKINSYTSISDHARHLFWYGRKSKRCFLKTEERNLFNDQDKRNHSEHKVHA